MAARGSRDLDSGEEFIDDAAVVATLRRQARKVYAEAMLLAIAVTAAFVLLPV